MSRLRFALAVAGFTAALFAVTTEDQRIWWVAIGLLVVSLLLRWLQRKRSG
jgi:hypothetical protein